MISVNTNQGAMVALQTLNRTNSDLEKTQNAISTGLKVASAKDNGAVWAIGNKLRSDVIAYDRVRESNDRASSVLDTAIAAGESIMELLNEMKGKALAGTQVGNSASAQAALAADFAQLRANPLEIGWRLHPDFWRQGLASEAALRAGAGLVSVATQALHVAPLLARLPEAMVHAVEDG